MGKMVQRGYVPSDKREFSEDGMEKLLAAGSNLYYLLNRGYPIKSASVFVGNHDFGVFDQRKGICYIDCR